MHMMYWIIIGAANDLVPGNHQTINTRTNVDLSSMRAPETHCKCISFKNLKGNEKNAFEIVNSKCEIFCLGLNVVTWWTCWYTSTNFIPQFLLHTKFSFVSPGSSSDIQALIQYKDFVLPV